MLPLCQNPEIEIKFYIMANVKKGGKVRDFS
jgi:hypothetical protein